MSLCCRDRNCGMWIQGFCFIVVIVVSLLRRKGNWPPVLLSGRLRMQIFLRDAVDLGMHPVNDALVYLHLLAGIHKGSDEMHTLAKVTDRVLHAECGRLGDADGLRYRHTRRGLLRRLVRGTCGDLRFLAVVQPLCSFPYFLREGVYSLRRPAEMPAAELLERVAAFDGDFQPVLAVPSRILELLQEGQDVGTVEAQLADAFDDERR